MSMSSPQSPYNTYPPASQSANLPAGATPAGYFPPQYNVAPTMSTSPPQSPNLSYLPEPQAPVPPPKSLPAGPTPIGYFPPQYNIAPTMSTIPPQSPNSSYLPEPPASPPTSLPGGPTPTGHFPAHYNIAPTMSTIPSQSPNSSYLPEPPASPPTSLPAGPTPIGYFPPQPNAASPLSYPQGYVPPGFIPPLQPYTQVSPPQGSMAPQSPVSYSAVDAKGPYQHVVPGLTSQPICEITPDGDITSHDPMLSTNSEALLAFLLAHLDPPTICLHIRGSHIETEQRLIPNAEGSTHAQKVQTITRTINDFEFAIDLSGSLVANTADVYTLADDEFAYRGKMERQILVPTGNASTAEQGQQALRVANANEHSRAENWERTRRSCGLPPWVTRVQHELGRAGASTPLSSSLSLSQWVDRYCASTKSLKQFNFNKVLYGLDLSTVQASVAQIIASTGHGGDIKVFFEITGRRIKIRAPSQLFQLMSHKTIKILLWIFLIYPLIWLFRYFSEEGGKWEVCGASYPLIRDPRDPPGAPFGTSSPMRDGDWVRIWERTIRLGIMNRLQSNRPIRRPVADDSSIINFE